MKVNLHRPSSSFRKHSFLELSQQQIERGHLLKVVGLSSARHGCREVV